VSKFLALALFLTFTRTLFAVADGSGAHGINVPILAADGSGAHGADIEADQNNPWFLGEQPIPYCIVLEKDSGLDRAEISRLVAESFEDWARFFNRHGYATLKFDEVNKLLNLPSTFADGVSRGLTLTRVEIPACNNFNRQLEIRFSKSAEADWAVDSNHAFGAAIRRHYDHEAYRTGGVVWISTQLKSSLERKHILLHELGHVLGMSHNSTYVMFEKVGRLIYQLRSVGSRVVAPETALGLIESSSWRYLLWPNDRLDFDSTQVTSWAAGSYSGSQPLLGALPSFPLLAPLWDNSWMRFDGKSSNGDLKFTLHLRGFGNERSLTGTFRRRYHQYEVGPSLHTSWKQKDGTLVAGRTYLEWFRAAGAMEVGGGSKQVPLEGAFSDSNNIYPAIIEFPYGAVVKVYDLKNGAWYTLSSYPFEVMP